MKTGGIDLALVRNSTTFVALEGDENTCKLIDEFEWKPGRVTLRLDYILPAIETRVHSLLCKRLGYDQHYAQSVVEHFDLSTRAIELVRAPAQISPLYLRFRRALERKQIDLSTASKKLQDQLACVSYHLGKTGILVELPESPDGSHCDIVAALLHCYHAMTQGVSGHVIGVGDRHLGTAGTERYNGASDDEANEE